MDHDVNIGCNSQIGSDYSIQSLQSNNVTCQPTNNLEIGSEIISSKRGLMYDTCLQPESHVQTSIYCIAPAENQTPIPFLCDPLFEEMANPTKFSTGSGGYFLRNRTTPISLKNYLNQRLLHIDGRFAKDIDYIFAGQYAVEAKQVRDDINIFLRQKKGSNSQGNVINTGFIKINALSMK